MSITFQRAWKKQLADHARQRAVLHAGVKSERILVNGHDRIGLAGEFAFSKFSGVQMDTSLRAAGDDGYDFVINVRLTPDDLPISLTLDVKTSSKGDRLLHEYRKRIADFYVLAHWNGEEALLVGWEWGHILCAIPAVDTGRGVINHCIPAERLRPMSELKAMLA